MAIKAVLRSLEGIDDAIKKLYKPAKVILSEGGKETEIDAHVLDVEELEQHPDTGPLLRAKQREKQRAQTAEDALGKVKTELQEYRDKEHERLRGMRPKEEVDALDKSYQGKLKERDDKILALEGGMHKYLVGQVARELATEVAVDTDAIPALLPHILPRLAVEMSGGEPTTRILDSAGKPSASTLADLKKELLAAKPLARLVSGTKANGGGAHGSDKNGGSAPQKIDFNKSPKEVAAALKAADTNPDSEE